MATTSCRVLVVDDEKDTAQTLACLLVGLGHEATFLTDPQQVFETTERVKPHLVFLDIGMPGMDGWQVAKLLRKQYPGEGQLRLVAISGHGAPEHHARSRQAGFDAHIMKPLAVDLIESIIKQLAPPC
jgi:CheY-like chemotaxis protein